MWINDLKNITSQGKFSQYSEEHIIERIFENIGVEKHYFLDIGANDGYWFSNTRNLQDNHGWCGVMIDGNHEVNGVKKHMVTRDNILAVLTKYHVPQEFDLLSIDIDGNDFYILREILMNYSPRMIVSEYNAEMAGSRTIQYDPEFEFNFDEYYGYTFEAGEKLAKFFEYTIIHQSSNLNLYMVRNDILVKMKISPGSIKVDHPIHRWWGKKSDKLWVEI